MLTMAAPTRFLITRKDRHLSGFIDLTRSKSISNRALMIRALSGEDFPITGLAAAADTQTMIRLLAEADAATTLDVGPAGTTFRFLTAYLSAQSGTQVLTGSERMLQRPIGVLVEALRSLGASIEYLGEAGYPPLRIGAPHPTFGESRRLAMPADVSSQYLSALLMLAPRLPHGLTLELVGQVVSRPYLQMTLNLMAYFGVSHRWEGNAIVVPPQRYVARAFEVEADWSAASYYYAMAAMSDSCDLRLGGLQADSVQGDAVLAAFMRDWGVETTFEGHVARLQKVGPAPRAWSYDFLECPDLAQAIAAMGAATGTTMEMAGLKTLKIKETDRIAALEVELAKVGVRFWESSPDEASLRGVLDATQQPTFETYEDHRMAMALAPLALHLPKGCYIHEPMVVGKSYPDYWKDLAALGFEVEERP